jgi:hypothetical protein
MWRFLRPFLSPSRQKPQLEVTIGHGRILPQQTSHSQLKNGLNGPVGLCRFLPGTRKGRKPEKEKKKKKKQEGEFYLLLLILLLSPSSLSST